jgi:hypothetical protein
MDGNNIMQFILDPHLTGWLLVTKFVFLALGFFFLGFIIWALVKISWFDKLIVRDAKEYLTYRPYYGWRKFDVRWQKIQKMVIAGLEPEAKLAIIEADSILNEVLKRIGHKGETFGERLDKATVDVLPNLEEVRRVHGIRNNIIHDPSYSLDIAEAKMALEVYRKALVELNVLS